MRAARRVIFRRVGRPVDLPQVLQRQGRPRQPYARAIIVSVQRSAEERNVALRLGKRGEKPSGVTAGDVPLTHLIIRTRPQDAPNAAGQVRRAPRAQISAIGYTVADFDRERARRELTAAGVQDVRDDGPYSLAMTDPFGARVRVTGLANTALTRG